MAWKYLGEPSPHPGTSVRWRELHGTATGAGHVVRARLGAYALIDATLGVRARYPGPVALRAPDLLHGQRDVIRDGPGPDVALATGAARLGKGNAIQGHAVPLGLWGTRWRPWGCIALGVAPAGAAPGGAPGSPAALPLQPSRAAPRLPA